MISSKERLLQAVKGNSVDRIPTICPGGMMNMITRELMDASEVRLPEAHVNARQMADLAKAIHTFEIFDNVGVPFCMTVEAEDMGARVSLGSDTVEPHVEQYVIETVDDFSVLHSLNMNTGRCKTVLDAISLLKAETVDIPIIGNITGPISAAGSVMDPVFFYRELVKKRKQTHAYLQFITDQLTSFALAQAEAGADIIAISDPSGTGEILGPKLFDEFLVTYINQILDALPKDTPTIVHICGKMHKVYEQLAKIHADVLSFDSIVSLKEAKNHLPNHVLMGNVSTYTLEYGTPESVQKLTQSCVRNGSEILSPACGLGMRSPLHNIRAIREAAEALYADR